MRGMVPRVLFTAWVLLFVAAPVIGEQTEPGFPTNLGLLNQLSEQAVSALLDSLDIVPGEKITVVSAAYSEGNDFIATALARDLAMRGVDVRLATESVPQAPASQPAGGVTHGAGATDSAGVSPAAGADSAGAAADSLKTEASTDSTSSSEPAAGSVVNAAPDSAGGTQPEEGAGPGEAAKIEEERQAEEAAKQAEESAATSAATGVQAAPAAAPAPPTVKPYPEGMVLEYRVLEFGVTYPVLKRRFLLFGDASVRRLGGVYITASRIKGPEGTVLKVAKAQSHQEDFLSGRTRLRAEGASYPFKQPVVPPANVGRYFEPVAVVGIITSLVYLFYQNQH